MAPSSRQLKFAADGAMQQQPIGLQVKVAVALPTAIERAVAIAGGEWLVGEKKVERGRELAYVLAALYGAFPA